MSTHSGNGVREIVRRAYNATIRPLLPEKYGVYAGVPVRRPALFDVTDHRPDFKAGFIDAIHEYVGTDDRAVIVGGGWGVSTVHCTRAGAVRVDVYEGSREMLEVGRETVRTAGSPERVEHHLAVVGEAIDVYGEFDDVERVDPADLDPGDVLVLDCEGAERSILDGMAQYPETVVVETHPSAGVPTAEIRQLLTAAGYQVETRPFQPGDDDKRVLVGHDRG